jgi:beta-lactam-binding protein with PASTA domain
VTRRYSRTVKKGRVIAQDEPPGTRLAPGTTVDLVVSRGRRPSRRGA